MSVDADTLQREQVLVRGRGVFFAAGRVLILTLNRSRQTSKARRRAVHALTPGPGAWPCWSVCAYHA